MTNKRSKTPFLLSFGMLSIMILSMVSSLALFDRISSLETGADRFELVFFMRQYQYELQRTNETFSAAYPQERRAGSRQEFNRWFDILWSRVQSIDTGSLGKQVVIDGFDVKSLKHKITEIDQILKSRQVIDSKTVEIVHLLLSGLVSQSHQYQLSMDFLDRERSVHQQQASLQSYRNTLLFMLGAFAIGVCLVIYLFKNYKKLHQLRWSLEDRVEQRTKELKDSNNELKKAITEHKITERQLKTSQKNADKAREKILYQANFDALTKLANRSFFMERFTLAIKRAQRNDSLVALLFLDLDRFKHINDTLGHSIGDELLKEASQRIVDVLRKGDTAARFGGDEFVIVLTDITKQSTVDLIVERILKSLASPFKLQGNDAFVSASIGITIYPDDGDSAETLLRKADSAMYKAKELGKNNYQYFTQQMDTEANQRRELEKALRIAVEQQQFSINYQPIVNAKSQHIVGAEALIRWQHPQMGAISPADFIPLAEEVGLVVEIGEWVLRNACRAAADWQLQDNNPLYVAVNMSSKQFQASDVALLIEQVLGQTGLAAECLVIEITESLLMAGDNHTMRQLERIRAMGIKLAIDDFGTGYSSLSYLKKFPISTLKIDQSFIKDINIDIGDDELIKGIISMAKNLNLNVVAEGVETQCQVNFLQKNQCMNLQGYFYSKPLPLLAFEQLINKDLLSQTTTMLQLEGPEFVH